MLQYSDPSLILTITILLFSYPAIMVGKAVAETWKPLFHLIFYCLLLGLVDRYLGYTLVEHTKAIYLISLLGYLIDTSIILAIALISHRYFLAKKRVSQYPWLYKKKGYFDWESIDSVQTKDGQN